MFDNVMVNHVKKALSQGDHVVGTMICELRGPSVPRMLAAAGFDFVILDTEHGTYSVESVADMAAVARGSGIVPIVRIPEIRKETVSRTLDIGVMGLLVPQVRTLDEVETVVRLAKYAPLGERGMALGRAHTDYQKGPASEWTTRLNEETLVIVQIETVEALADIDTIASVEGIDALFVGPNDLAAALGVPGQLDHPKLSAAIERVIAAAKDHDVAAGIHLFDLAVAKEWQDRGIRLLTVLNDLTMIINTGSEAVKFLKGGAA